MEATEMSIKDILSCRKFPIVAVKPYEIDEINKLINGLSSV